MLETDECIQISNKGRNYTDCMEFSLLRFLQLCAYNCDQIQTNKFSGYNEYIKNESKSELTNFIKTNPIIYPEAEFYRLTDEGKKQRADWAEFVSDRDFLDYYRNDKAELFTSVTNIIKFFNGFFNMDFDILTPQESLNLLGTKFSNKNKNISIRVEEINSNTNFKTMDDILRSVSRPEVEYTKYIGNNKLYPIIISTTYLDLIIDGFAYEWALTELYFKDSELFENKFITGHSVIYNK